MNPKLYTVATNGGPIYPVPSTRDLPKIGLVLVENEHVRAGACRSALRTRLPNVVVRCNPGILRGNPTYTTYGTACKFPRL